VSIVHAIVSIAVKSALRQYPVKGCQNGTRLTFIHYTSYSLRFSAVLRATLCNETNGGFFLTGLQDSQDFLVLILICEICGICGLKNGGFFLTGLQESQDFLVLILICEICGICGLKNGGFFLTG